MKRQATLSSWFAAASKKASYVSDPEPDSEEPSQLSATDAPTESSGVKSATADTAATASANCMAVCCDASSEKPFQPTDTTTLSSFTVNNRSFQPQWYEKFAWLTVCMTTKRAYCFYCKYAMQSNLSTFSRMSDSAFTKGGFQNWRKAMEKFTTHDSAQFHREPKLSG